MNKLHVLIIYLTFYTAISTAGPSKLIKCLAHEEQSLHLKKDNGPNYILNQRVLNLMIQTPIDHIKNSIVNKVCAAKTSPTKLLLKKAMLQQMDLFHFSKSKDPIKEQQVLAISESFIEQSFTIFFDYLWSWQKYVTDPNCLEKTIPNYQSLMNIYKYLEDSEPKRTLFQPNNIKKAFNVLENSKRILAKCNS